MKANSLRGIPIGLVAALVLCGPAMAAVTEPITVDVPFDFVVEKTPLPAGRYVVEPLETSDSGSAVIRSEDGRREVTFITEESTRRSPVTDTELVFDEAGGAYRLCQIWVAGVAEGSVLPTLGEREHKHRMIKAVTLAPVSR